MGKQDARHAHRSVRDHRQGSMTSHSSRGVVKPCHRSRSALSAAIAQRKQAGNSGATAIAAASSLAFLEQRAVQASSCDDSDQIAAQVLDLLRECVTEMGGSIPLTSLGGAIREKATRRGLQQAQDGAPRPLHKYVRLKWGSWEGFVRAHAAESFVVTSGCLREKLPSSHSQLMDANCESSNFPARSAQAVTSKEVNAISLDAL